MHLHDNMNRLIFIQIDNFWGMQVDATVLPETSGHFDWFTDNVIKDIVMVLKEEILNVAKGFIKSRPKSETRVTETSSYCIAYQFRTNASSAHSIFKRSVGPGVLCLSILPVKLVFCARQQNLPTPKPDAGHVTGKHKMTSVSEYFERTAGNEQCILNTVRKLKIKTRAARRKKEIDWLLRTKKLKKATNGSKEVTFGSGEIKSCEIFANEPVVKSTRISDSTDSDHNAVVTEREHSADMCHHPLINISNMNFETKILSTNVPYHAKTTSETVKCAEDLTSCGWQSALDGVEQHVLDTNCEDWSLDKHCEQQHMDVDAVTIDGAGSAAVQNNCVDTDKTTDVVPALGLRINEVQLFDSRCEESDMELPVVSCKMRSRQRAPRTARRIARTGKEKPHHLRLSTLLKEESVWEAGDAKCSGSYLGSVCLDGKQSGGGDVLEIDDCIVSESGLGPGNDLVKEQLTIVDLASSDCEDVEVKKIVRAIESLSEGELQALVDKHMQYFKGIFHGKIDCTRHESYKKGGNLRNNLTYQVRLGLYSDDQVDVIMRSLMTTFCNHHTKYLDYVTKVLLPEAAIKIVMESGDVTHEKAEKILKTSGALYLDQ